MHRKRRIQLLTAVASASLPIILWAYSSGPDPGKTGAPGEDPNSCTGSGCHNGPITKDSSLIDILWEGGQNYQPGTKQRFTIRVKDTGRRYGIQVSARVDSGAFTTNQAGTFTPLSTSMFVLCADGRDRNDVPNKTCPPAAPIEYIEHSTPSGTGEFTFDWTPPASATAGPVTIYVAANASAGLNPPSGAKIHQKTLKLQPGAAGGGVRPTITAGGVVSAAAFGGGTKVAPGSWIEIFGKDFSLTTREWAGGDFAGSKAPTNLDNTQVTVDGKAAFVRFISPGQVNVQVPDGIASNVIQVAVKTAGGTSDPITLTGAARAPGLLAPSSFLVGGKQYVAAQFSDGAFAGRVGLINGVTFRLPKPGDRLVIYGVGFGATNPAIAAGSIASVASDLGTALKVQVGSAVAATEYRGLAPNFVGLYQFNIVVPNVQAGDQEIYMEIDGVRTQTGVFLTTGN